MMLYYSTNPTITTVRSIVEECTKVLPKVLKEYKDDVFAAYNAASEGYFKEYPNTADMWYYHLDKEYQDGIPVVIASYLTRRYGCNQPGYDTIHRELCARFI